MRPTPSLAALLLATAAYPAVAQTDATPAAQPQTAAPAASTVEQDVEEEGEAATEVTVVGQRERGSVPGDIQPEQVLRPADIRSYGANSIGDLVAELAPQLGGGRGAEGGQPIFLLNGRPVSSPGQIFRFPAEAIERVDVLPPEAAQQLGYRAEQRVLNFVFRRRFNAVNAEIEGGGTTRGDRFTTDNEATLTRIMRDRLLNLSLKYTGQTPIYEADRDIIPTPPGLPYSITGNLTPGSGLTQIDPALSALAGSTVAVVGVPAGLGGRPALGSFLGGVNPSDFGAYRTVSPAQQAFEGSASYQRPIGDVDAALTGEFSWNRRETELGLAPVSLTLPSSNPFSPFSGPVTLNRYLVEGGPRTQAVDTTNGRLSFALNGDIARWRWSFTGNYARNFSSTLTDDSFDLTPIVTRLAASDPDVNPFAPFTPGLLGDYRQNYARRLTNQAGYTSQANGPLFTLPAGDATLSLRTGFQTTNLEGRSIRSSVTTVTENDRSVGNGQARINLPIARRGRGVLSALGNLSANAAYEYEQVSDFGWLSTYSGGLNWDPLPGRISLIATLSRDANAPSVEQLGDPVVVTPNTRVFDFVRGVSVDATVVTGGNQALRASDRRRTNLTLNLRPFAKADFNLRAEYTRTRTFDPVQFLSTPTAALEAAFPDRFLRDAAGQLIRLDNRPVNVERSDQVELNWGFNLSLPVGSATPARGGFGGTGASRPATAETQAQARPSQPQAPEASVGTRGPEQRAAPAGGAQQPGVPGGGRRFGGGGGRGAFGSGFGGGNQGRINVSINHKWRFQDTLTIGPGIPVLDRLNGDATGFGSNVFEHSVDANAGIFKSGYGLRARLIWESGAYLRGGSAQTPIDIRSEPLTRITLRSFVQFNPTMKAVRDHPWLLGTRVELAVNNLFDARRRITDANGNVPINFQPDLIDPVGRAVTLSLRKLFFQRPQGRPGGALGGGAGALRR